MQSHRPDGISVAIVQFTMFSHDLINLSEGLKNEFSQFLVNKVVQILSLGVLSCINEWKFFRVNTDLLVLTCNG